ncbi:MAG: hypothetical protein Q7W45_07240 [Bacteroidota bacterium]|nr:hypothetical protein [Bacteroidota bacterium]MDP3143935.1 hypothetical protein [Bacteroidota bacterium]MDP3557566.1 hypothetical protein [Bacteroidota bacterium]
MKTVLVIAFTFICFINSFAQDGSAKTNSISVLSIINPTSTITDSNSRSQSESQFNNSSDANQSGDLRPIKRQLNITDPPIIESEKKNNEKKNSEKNKK